jgi:hypothetical protein
MGNEGRAVSYFMQKQGAWDSLGPTSMHNLFNATEGDAYQYGSVYMDEVRLQNWQMTHSGKWLCTDKQIANACTKQKGGLGWELIGAPVQGNVWHALMRRDEDSSPRASESADDMAGIGDHLQMHPCCAEQSQGDDNVKPMSSDHITEHQEEEVHIGSGMDDLENELVAHSIKQSGNLQWKGDQEESGQRATSENDINVSPMPIKGTIHAIGGEELCMLSEVKSGVQDNGQRDSSQCAPSDLSPVWSSERNCLAKHAVELVAHEQQALPSEDLRMENLADVMRRLFFMFFH